MQLPISVKLNLGIEVKIKSNGRIIDTKRSHTAAKVSITDRRFHTVSRGSSQSGRSLQRASLSSKNHSDQMLS